MAKVASSNLVIRSTVELQMSKERSDAVNRKILCAPQSRVYGTEGYYSLESGTKAGHPLHPFSPLCTIGVFCYNTLMISRFRPSAIMVAIGMFLPSLVSAQPANGPQQNQAQVKLLEKLTTNGGGSGNVNVLAGAGTFLEYFNQSVDWIFTVASGFALVWILIGGFMFMTSGNNQSRRSEAISRITWAVLGMLMLLFAGFILRTLNSQFYV